MQTRHKQDVMEENTKYENGDLDDFHREPNGVHAKDQSGWRGLATTVDLTALDEGTIRVRWNGRCILTSVRTTRPHIISRTNYFQHTS